MKPSSPRATIAIPTRNRAALLRECLESVLSQTLPEFEVYVSDNASTDDTPAVVASFKDPRVHYAPLERNIGLYGNMSRCLRLGTAPYVVVIPDDDLMLPNNLEQKVRVLDEQPNVGIVHSAIHLVHLGPEGELSRQFVNHGRSDHDVIEPGSVVVGKLLTEPYWLTITAAVFRRGVVGDERFEEADGPPADLGFCLRVALRTDVAYLTEPLVICRWQPEAASVKEGIIQADASYEYTIKSVALVHRVKERFLRQYSYRIPNSHAVRVACRRKDRRFLLVVARRTFGPERAPLAVLRQFAAARIHPKLILSPPIARFVLESFLPLRARKRFGPPLRRLKKGLRRVSLRWW